MPKFSPADLLDADNSSRLRVIVFYKMGKDLMGSFKDLLTSEKRVFNGFLNEYIAALPEIDWFLELKRDFDELVLKKILHESFDASKSFCPEINTAIQELRNEEIQGGGSDY